MTNRMVKSPYGADIEIVPDERWAPKAEGNPTLRQWSASKPYILRELWEHGPVVDEKSGRATRWLNDRIREHYPESIDSLPENLRAFGAMLNNPVNSPAFRRHVNEKRTYRIELVSLPEIWYRKLTEDIEATMPTFTATPITTLDTNGTQPEAIEEPPPVTIEEMPPLETVPAIEPLESSPSIEVEIASQVAMELLTKVVEIISAGSAGGMTDNRIRQLTRDMELVSQRLGQRVQENDTMRRKLSEIGEELFAVKKERDGLRMRLRQTETNLSAALKGESAHAVTTEVMKRVDRIMRETPQPNRGDE